ncbi:MAG: cyclic nucleotide-binding domain-containing protein [Desulfobacterales bacterium]
MLESKYLKDDMRNIQQLLSISALKDLEPRDHSRLLRLSKIRKYKDGEVIIEENDNDPWFYFLLSGKCCVRKDGVEIATIDEAGDIFGEMSPIDGMGRSGSVYAMGDTVCLAVDTESKHRLNSEREAVNLLNLLYRAASEFLSARLRLTNEKLVAAEKEIARLKAGPAQPRKAQSVPRLRAG